MPTEIVNAFNLQTGDLICIGDDEIGQIRRTYAGEAGWMVLVIYRQDLVSYALVQETAAVARYTTD